MNVNQAIVAKRRQLAILALRALLVLVLGTSFGTATAASWSGSTGDCYVSPSAPLRIKLKAGRQAVVTCVDGQMKVTYRKAPKHQPQKQTRDDEDYVTVTYPAVDYVPDPEDVEGSGYTGQATCNLDSTLYDNSAANIRMTWLGQRLAWKWNSDTGKIRRLGAAYGFVDYERKTGWGQDDHFGPKLFARTMSGNGKKWIKQGMEAWSEFSNGGHYRHQHHTTLWVNRDGDCTGVNEFSGTVPNFAYQVMIADKTPYQATIP